MLYQAVSPVLIDEVVTNAAMKERMWESLFLDSETFDHFRKQRAVEAHLTATLNKATQDYDKAYFPRATAVEWNLLHSLPGGQKQAPHRDYNFPMNFPHLDQDRMPRGLIVAMEANTVLHSYGWNHIVAEERNEHVVHLGKGDILLFRGDFIHARAEYKTCNTRVHGYLNLPGTKRQRNSTDRVPITNHVLLQPSSFARLYCERTYSSADSRRKHMDRLHNHRVNRT